MGTVTVVTTLPLLSQTQEAPLLLQSFVCSWDTHLLSKHKFFLDLTISRL